MMLGAVQSDGPGRSAGEVEAVDSNVCQVDRRVGSASARVADTSTTAGATTTALVVNRART
jgi:hypothetical protein